MIYAHWQVQFVVVCLVQIEIGMGIHGEAGIKQSHLQSADVLASIMAQTIEI